MNRKIRNYQIFSVIFTLILGTLFHFTYELSGQNPLVAFFSSINESVWEHLKLLYFPMLLTIIIGILYLRGERPASFLCSKTIGIIVALIFIIVFFYTYTGIIGRNIAVVDIASFAIAAILGEYVAYRLMTDDFKCNDKIAMIVLLILLGSFVLFTYNTPNLEIFRDPVTGEMGRHI